MSNRPRDWYQLTWEQRQAWEKAERERQDLESDAQRARDDADAAERNVRRLRREADAARHEAQEEVAQARDAVNEAEIDLRALTEQRDALLAALRGLAYDPGSGSPLRYCQHASEPCPRCEAARAAVAKAEGG